MLNVVSITDLKQNTKGVVEKVKFSGKPVIIIQRSEPAAVLVDPEYYEKLEQALENMEDLQAIEERRNEPTVSFEEVAKKIGYKLK